MAKVLDCNIKVSDFDLQSRYHLQVRKNNLGRSTEPPLSLPAMGWVVSLLFFSKDSFGIKQPSKFDMLLKQWKQTKIYLFAQ